MASKIKYNEKTPSSFIYELYTLKSTVLKTVGNQAFASVHPKVKLKVSKKNKYKTYKKLVKL